MNCLKRNKKMIKKTRRILDALSLNVPDKLPSFEMGINPHPLLKLTIGWKNIPKKLKSLIRKTKFYPEYIDVVRENFKMGSKYRKMWRKPLFMKKTADLLFSVPTNWKDNYQKMIMYYVPVSVFTDYDGLGYPLFPSTKIVGRKDGLLVTESGMAVDIDPRTANIRWRSVPYEAKKQAKFVESAIKNFDWDYGIKTYKKLKNVKICKPLTALGYWEIWDSLYGVMNLTKFYIEIQREFRKGYGFILDLWDSLDGFFFDAIKRYSRIGSKIIGILDDLVYDEGPFVNPKYYKKYLYPHYKRVVDEAHRRGMKVFFHTDGKLDSVIEDIIDCGFDGLQSIQADINNFDYIKKNYGDKICLIGGISSKNLDLKSKNEIYTETKRKVLIGKKNGGYIAGSDNMIHDSVKIDNMFAMLEAIKKYGI
jgi:hypothetical protein